MKCQVVSCAVVVCSRDLDPQQRNTCHRSDCAFGEQYTCVSHRNGSKGTSSGVSSQFAIIRQVGGCSSCQRTVDQDSQFELHALPDRQPVKLIQGGCDMITSTQTHRKASSGILN